MNSKTQSITSASVNPILIVISAPSGAGKTTLCSRLLQARPDARLSVSTTTRAPRGNEKDGIEYHFVDRAKFEDQIQKGRFAEWANVHGHYYGTSKETIESSFRDGKHVVLDIDVQGAASLRKAYGSRCMTIFVSPPDLQTLEARLRSRGTDSDEVVAKRMKNARHEMEAAPQFDHIIINDRLDRACNELLEFVNQRLSQPDGVTE